MKVSYYLQLTADGQCGAPMALAAAAPAQRPAADPAPTRLLGTAERPARVWTHLKAPVQVRLMTVAFLGTKVHPLTFSGWQLDSMAGVARVRRGNNNENEDLHGSGAAQRRSRLRGGCSGAKPVGM